MVIKKTPGSKRNEIENKYSTELTCFVPGCRYRSMSSPATFCNSPFLFTNPKTNYEIGIKQ